jgi:hypothetical protein
MIEIRMVTPYPCASCGMPLRIQYQADSESEFSIFDCPACGARNHPRLPGTFVEVSAPLVVRVKAPDGSTLDEILDVIAPFTRNNLRNFVRHIRKLIQDGTDDWHWRLIPFDKGLTEYRVVVEASEWRAESNPIRLSESVSGAEWNDDPHWRGLLPSD